MLHPQFRLTIPRFCLQIAATIKRDGCPTRVLSPITEKTSGQRAGYNTIDIYVKMVSQLAMDVLVSDLVDSQPGSPHP